MHPESILSDLPGISLSCNVMVAQAVQARLQG